MKKLKEIAKALVSLSKQVEKLSKQVEKSAPKKATRKVAAKKTAVRKAGVKTQTQKTAGRKKAGSKQITVLDNVMGAISRSRKGATVAQLKEKTGLGTKQLSNALYKLSKKGVVETKARGVYIKK